MAIVVGNSTDLGDNGSAGATLTTAHNNNGNILFVGVVEASTNKMQSVTYNGVAMTELTTSTASPVQVPGDRYIHLFYLVNPAQGSNNVVVTLTGTDFIQGLAISYSGVDTGSPIDVAGNNTGSTVASLAKSLTTTINGDWTVAMFAANGGTASAGASTTERVSAASFPQFAMYDSNAALAPGSNTLTVNVTSTPNAAMIMAAFKPIQEGGYFHMSI